MEKFNKEDRVFMSYATAVARLMFARKWRIIDCPTIEEWKVKLPNYMDMDKLTRQIRGQNLEQNNKNCKWENYIAIK